MNPPSKSVAELIQDAFRTDEVMDVLVEGMGCGPFDGGCLITALALQRIFGGEVAWMEENEHIHHYGVLLPDGRYLDADGPIFFAKWWVHRFCRNEGLTRNFTVHSGDFSYDPKDHDGLNITLVDQLEQALRKFLTSHIPSDKVFAR